MRPWWFALVVLAGCYAPTAPAGAPCADGRTCPTGLVCETVSGVDVCIVPGTLAPDAPLDAADAAPDTRPGDRDGDGVDDEGDLCPDIADDQHDEDEDQLGDACDGCPISADMADEDSDGIPDGCDPNREADGDAIAAFGGFGAASSYTDWGIGEGWIFEADRVRFLGNDVATFGSFLGPPVRLKAQTVVAAAITVQQIEAGGGIGVGLGVGASGVSCAFIAGGTGINLAISDIDQATVIGQGPLPSPILGQRWFIFLARTSPDTYQCTATNEIGDQFAALAPVINTQPDELAPFLVGLEATAAVDWLLVTTAPAN